MNTWGRWRIAWSIQLDLGLLLPPQLDLAFQYGFFILRGELDLSIHGDVTFIRNP